MTNIKTYDWLKITNEEKRKVLSEMTQQDIEMIKEFKIMFNADVQKIELKGNQNASE